MTRNADLVAEGNLLRTTPRGRAVYSSGGLAAIVWHLVPFWSRAYDPAVDVVTWRGPAAEVDLALGQSRPAR